MTVLDLTHPLHAGVTVYPGTPAPRFEACNTIERDGFAELEVRMSTHTGTHMDAPCHVIPGARSLDRFPAERFVGPGVVLDVAGLDRVGLDRLQAEESRIAQAEFVLLRTGWDRRWTSPDYFTGFPTLTEEAAGWLAARPIKAVCVDAISVDPVDAELLPVHHALLGRDILIVENLTGLERLPGGPFEFWCAPLRIEGADGSPVRALARF